MLVAGWWQEGRFRERMMGPTTRPFRSCRRERVVVRCCFPLLVLERWRCSVPAVPGHYGRARRDHLQWLRRPIRVVCRALQVATSCHPRVYCPLSRFSSPARSRDKATQEVTVVQALGGLVCRRQAARLGRELQRRLPMLPRMSGNCRPVRTWGCGRTGHRARQRVSAG
jgi:hypothetical protein